MREWQWIVLVLAVMVAALIVAAAVAKPAQAAEVEPGVDASVVVDPASGEGETTVNRTVTITNSNEDRNKVYNIGIVIRGPGGSGDFPLPANYTAFIPGSRRNRVVDMLTPGDCVYIPGSLYINDMLQPNPSVTGLGHYSLVVDLPANASLIIRDQLLISPPA